MLLLFSDMIGKSPAFGKELFSLFIVCVFRERLSMFVCASFSFGFEGGMWVLIVLVPDHCLSFYALLIIVSRGFYFTVVFRWEWGGLYQIEDLQSILDSSKSKF